MAKYCIFFIALPLPVIVRTICLFDNFEKLSMLLGFSRDVLKGWARVCCRHVFLVYIYILSHALPCIIFPPNAAMPTHWARNKDQRQGGQPQLSPAASYNIKNLNYLKTNLINNLSVCSLSITIQVTAYQF